MNEVSYLADAGELERCENCGEYGTVDELVSRQVTWFGRKVELIVCHTCVQEL